MANDVEPSVERPTVSRVSVVFEAKVRVDGGTDVLQVCAIAYAFLDPRVRYS